jgi:hypothetical protein
MSKSSSYISVAHPRQEAVPAATSNPALLDILEKSVRELGAIRLIDSRIGVPGQLARNPRVILGDSGQQSDLHRFNFAFCWSISGFTPYIQTSIEPVDRSVIAFVGLGTPTLLG